MNTLRFMDSRQMNQVHYEEAVGKVFYLLPLLLENFKD